MESLGTWKVASDPGKLDTFLLHLVLINLNLNRHMCLWTSLVTQMVKNLPEAQETRVQSLSQEDSLEKGMATHSNIPAWRIPWTEEPGRLLSMGSQGVGHNWATNTVTSHVSLDCLGLGILWFISKTLEFILMSTLLLVSIFPISCLNHLWLVKTHTHTHTHI